MAINQPAGNANITWSSGTARRLNQLIRDRQKVIDSECLRLCSPLIPFRTGALERSGTTGTVIGSGEVKYTAPYARKQYYSKTTRSYDRRRGGKWFERMKVANKDELEDIVNGKKGG